MQKKVSGSVQSRGINVRTHTCNMASIELEAQGDAVPPRLRSDPDKPGQNWLRDPVQNHLSWVCVGMENLARQKTNKSWTLSEGNELFMSYLSFSPTCKHYILLYTHP